MSPSPVNGGISTSRHEALAEVVGLYYNDGLDQREIADRIGLSRSTVSRMITEARDLGIVEIRIHRPLPTDDALREAVISRYSLRDALILSSDGIRGGILERVGALAAKFLETVLPDKGTMAVSWGTSLAATVNALPGAGRHDIRVVQMIGAAGSLHPEVDGAELARNLASRLGGSAVALNAPLIVDQPELAQALLRQESIASVLDLAATADVALIGLGGMDPSISSLLRSGFATKAELKRAMNAGIVGDVGGHMLDIDGTTVDSELSQRTLALDEKRLRAIPMVITVAAGPEKVEVIHAALQSGIVDVIVSDTQTMEAVLALGRARSLQEAHA